MPLRQLSNFLTVAECGSINKAAAQLSITHQALRASMESLEKKLGCALFKRTHRGITLTPRGEKIAGDVRKIIAIASDWDKLDTWDGQTEVTVRMAGTSALLNSVLPHFVLQARRRYPNLVLELHETRMEEVFSLLVREQMPGVVGSVPPAREQQFRIIARKNSLRLEKVGADDYQVVLNRSHPAAAKSSLRLADLGQFMVAMYPQNDQNFHYRDIYRHFSPNMPFLCMRKQENILSVVASEKTVAAVFPKSAIARSSVWGETLVSLPVADFPMPGSIFLVHSEEDNLSSAERLVLSLLRDTLKDL